MSADFVTIQEVVQAAHRNLSHEAWDYLVGGSESETTMRRNRLAFDRLALRPRVLVDVTQVDTTTTLLGHPMANPVILAPLGSSEVVYADGAAAAAQAASQFGALQVVSSVSQPSLEETSRSGSGPKLFQLYVQGDMAWVRDLLQRVREAGYSALCLTVDVPVLSRRERTMQDRYSSPSTMTLNEAGHRAALTWDSLDAIKSIWGGGPFLLKGIASAEDARLAVDHGVDVVWVSNHGGRQLDHGEATMDVLPEVVEAVAGRAEVVVDGGVQRGTDVLKAVALGARAVAIGKLQGWGLAAAGSEGVLRVLQLLQDEITVSMALLGVTRIDQLDAGYIRRAEAVTPPHEMSAWVNLPEGRLR